MRLPAAATYLARVIHVTSDGSLARAIEEGRLELRSAGPPDEMVLSPIRSLAREERVVCEEARALAAARGWPTNLAGQPYGWVRLRGEVASQALPRIVRVYKGEVFELEGLARDCADEVVSSLLQAAADARHSTLRELSAGSPLVTLPGAK